MGQAATGSRSDNFLEFPAHHSTSEYNRHDPLGFNHDDFFNDNHTYSRPHQGYHGYYGRSGYNDEPRIEVILGIVFGALSFLAIVAFVAEFVEDFDGTLVRRLWGA